MYLTVGMVFAIALVLLSPAIWVAWWLLSDLGSRANGWHGDAHESAKHSYRRAA